ncbi:MAG: hypothetical protein ACO3EP_06455 [Phycisphaerales bacterium]
MNLRTNHRGALAGLLLAPLLGGCASNAIEVSVQTRAESYRDIGNPRDVLFSTPPRCAVLPANAGATPGFGIFMNTAIEQVLRERAAEESVIGPSETGNLLSESGLRTQLDALLNSWQPSNVLDPDGLRAIGEALGVPYLVVPYLVTYSTNNNSRITFLGVTFVRTGWTTIQVALQLWHAPTGVLVWQGQGISTLGCEGIIGPPVPTGATIEEAVRPMLADFLSGRSESIVSKQLPRPSTTASTAPTIDAPDAERAASGSRSASGADASSRVGASESNAPITRSDEGERIEHPRVP